MASLAPYYDCRGRAVGGSRNVGARDKRPRHVEQARRLVPRGRRGQRRRRAAKLGRRRDAPAKDVQRVPVKVARARLPYRQRIRPVGGARLAPRRASDWHLYHHGSGRVGHGLADVDRAAASRRLDRRLHGPVHDVRRAGYDDRLPRVGALGEHNRVDDPPPLADVYDAGGRVGPVPVRRCRRGAAGLYGAVPHVDHGNVDKLRARGPLLRHRDRVLAVGRPERSRHGQARLEPAVAARLGRHGRRGRPVGRLGRDGHGPRPVKGPPVHGDLGVPARRPAAAIILRRLGPHRLDDRVL